MTLWGSGDLGGYPNWGIKVGQMGAAALPEGRGQGCGF